MCPPLCAHGSCALGLGAVSPNAPQAWPVLTIWVSQTSPLREASLTNDSIFLPCFSFLLIC